MNQIWIIHRLGSSERLCKLTSQLQLNLDLDLINIVCTENCFDFGFAYPDTIPDSLVSIGYVLRPLTYPEQSVFKKHVRALKGIADCQGPFGLVFEDDVGFLSYDQFSNFWYRSHLTPGFIEYDILFFGTGAHQRLEGTGILIPNHTWHKTKCADSYLISPSAAHNVLQDYKIYPPFMPYDWDLSLRINRLKLNVGWLQPGLTYQGSQTGHFMSTIQNIHG